jgi:hypothetical protein
MSITDRSHIVLADRDDPVLLAWPTPGNAGGFVRFEKAADWRAFVESLDIDTRIPEIVRAKFARAQTLYLLGFRAGAPLSQVNSQLTSVEIEKRKAALNVDFH